MKSRATGMRAWAAILAASISACVAKSVRETPAVIMRSRTPAPPPVYKLTWPATYNMSLSTLTNPDGNTTGPEGPQALAIDAKYGIITFDGNFERCLNTRKGPQSDPCMYRSTQTHVEVTARAIKAINPRTRVFTYHNQEEALQRRQQDCQIMYDPAYEQFFIRNASGIVNNHVKTLGQSGQCSAVAPVEAYSLGEDQYALDFRNASVQQWWLDTVIGTFLKSDVLDGFYWDCPSLTSPFLDGLTESEVADANAKMADTREIAKGRIAAAGKWSLGMMTLMEPPQKCPALCGLQWRAIQSNCTPWSCDRSAQTCMESVKAAISRAEEATTMYIPYVAPADETNNVKCATPAAVVDPELPFPLELSCLPGTGTLSIEFAAFGTPNVTDTTGKFITCSGAGCADNTTIFWEDTTSRTAYAIKGNGYDDCGKCIHRPGRCGATPVDAATFGRLTVALQPFSCKVQRSCAAFAADPACDAGPAVLATIREACDGKQSCVVNISAHTLPTPKGCPANSGPLRLAVRATGCQQGTAVAGFRENLAAFLISRGPHAWTGHNWIAGLHPTWYPEWDLDFGEPVAPPVWRGAVATRLWTKFNVSLDCNRFEASFVSNK